MANEYDFDQDELMLPIFHHDNGIPLSAEEIQNNIVGKANCGCVYHAEEGLPCVHDVELWKRTKQG